MSYSESPLYLFNACSNIAMHRVSLTAAVSICFCVGIYLRGAALFNNSYVAVDRIGEEENTSLQCLTHMDPGVCCGFGSESSTTSGWFLPNETMIPTNLSTEGYHSNRGVGVIHLYRDSVNNTDVATGRFYCQIPSGDIQNLTIQTYYVNICKFIILIDCCYYS